MENLGFRVRVTRLLVPILVEANHLPVNSLKAEMRLAILSFTPLATRVKESDLPGQILPSSFSTPFVFCLEHHQ